MKIRKMVSGDIPAVSDLELQGFGKTDKDELEKSLKNSNYVYFVADYSGIIVGFISFLVSGEICDIISIVVDKMHRQKGVGKLLTEKMFKHLKSKEIITIFLEVRVSNIPAIKLYKKMGFEPLNIRKKYYDGIEDALIMKCECKELV